MYDLGLRSKKGGEVTRNGLATIFHNPFYIGLIKLKSTGEMFLGKHQPLISKKLFYKVQDVLCGKNNEKKNKHFFVFRRLIKCGYCGQTLIGELQKGRIYYRCHNRNCPQKTIREEMVEIAFMDKLKKLRFNEAEKHYFRQWLKSTYKSVSEFGKNQTTALKLRLDQIRDRQNKLADAYIDGVFDKETYQEKRSTLLLEEKDIKENLDGLDKSEYKSLVKIEGILELATNAYLSYKLANPDQKRDLVKIITSNLAVKGRNVVVEPKIPFSEIENRPKIKGSSPYRAVPRTFLAWLRHFFVKIGEIEDFEDGLINPLKSIKGANRCTFSSRKRSQAI